MQRLQRVPFTQAQSEYIGEDESQSNRVLGADVFRVTVDVLTLRVSAKICSEKMPLFVGIERKQNRTGHGSK